jgi:hypothetical protein
MGLWCVARKRNAPATKMRPDKGHVVTGAHIIPCPECPGFDLKTYILEIVPLILNRQGSVKIGLI